MLLQSVSQTKWIQGVKQAWAKYNSEKAVGGNRKANAVYC